MLSANRTGATTANLVGGADVAVADLVVFSLSIRSTLASDHRKPSRP
jgi:hypothetical protein